MLHRTVRNCDDCVTVTASSTLTNRPRLVLLHSLGLAFGPFRSGGEILVFQSIPLVEDLQLVDGGLQGRRGKQEHVCPKSKLFCAAPI